MRRARPRRGHLHPLDRPADARRPARDRPELRTQHRDDHQRVFPERERRVRISVGVAYGSDADHVEETLRSVAAAEDVVLDEPEPRVRFRGFGESALDVELLCWIPAPVLRGRATHRLNKAVYQAFRGEDIEIPFPQRVVTMNSADAASGLRTGPAPAEDRPGTVD
ncbi:mechanosensitive ion channel family protein [Halosimplex aquaticum]